MDSIFASHPAAPGSILEDTEIHRALLDSALLDSGIRTTPSSTKQGSANPVGAHAKLVLQKVLWNLLCQL